MLEAAFYGLSDEGPGLRGNQLLPERIAYNLSQSVFYVSSTTNGDVVQVDVENGAVSTFAAGACPTGRW